MAQGYYIKSTTDGSIDAIVGLLLNNEKMHVVSDEGTGPYDRVVFLRYGSCDHLIKVSYVPYKQNCIFITKLDGSDGIGCLGGFWYTGVYDFILTFTQEFFMFSMKFQPMNIEEAHNLYIFKLSNTEHMFIGNDIQGFLSTDDILTSPYYGHGRGFMVDSGEYILYPALMCVEMDSDVVFREFISCLYTFANKEGFKNGTLLSFNGVRFVVVSHAHMVASWVLKLDT